MTFIGVVAVRSTRIMLLLLKGIGLFILAIFYLVIVIGIIIEYSVELLIKKLYRYEKIRRNRFRGINGDSHNDIGNVDGLQKG